jgi:hypothetical protein
MQGYLHSRGVKIHDLPRIEKQIQNQELSLQCGLGAWHNVH